MRLTQFINNHSNMLILWLRKKKRKFLIFKGFTVICFTLSKRAKLVIKTRLKFEVKIPPDHRYFCLGIFFFKHTIIQQFPYIN